jgi:hypothetical protein
MTRKLTHQAGDGFRQPAGFGHRGQDALDDLGPDFPAPVP